MAKGKDFFCNDRYTNLCGYRVTDCVYNNCKQVAAPKLIINRTE